MINLELTEKEYELICKAVEEKTSNLMSTVLSSDNIPDAYRARCKELYLQNKQLLDKLIKN